MCITQMLVLQIRCSTSVFMYTRMVILANTQMCLCIFFQWQSLVILRCVKNHAHDLKGHLDFTPLTTAIYHVSLHSNIIP